MSDHAGDVTRKIMRGYVGHPWNARDGISAGEWSREHCTFAVFTSDGGAFRVTIDDVGYDGLTLEELDADRYQLAEDDPNYSPPLSRFEKSRATHELMADGSLRPIP
jgi:hypothetical protein